MAYRYTDTNKWTDNWFCDLKATSKLLFLYLCDLCDLAGFMEINEKKIGFDLVLGKQEVERGLRELEGRLLYSVDGKYIYIRNFIKHQKNLPLNSKNAAHRGIIRRLEEMKQSFGFQSIEYFFKKPLGSPLVAPSKGLDSPYGIGIGNIDSNRVKDNIGGMGGKEGEEEEEDENTDNWRESFDVYCDRLREAYESLSNDDEFIAQRQSLHPGIDIRLSLKKAYLDYWSTELGWKKKKNSKSSNIDWKRTFINALDLPSNQVKKARGKVDLKSLTSIRQTNLYSYLEKEAPLILEMPIFPSDEEIEILNRMNRQQLTEIVKKINNDDRLIKFKNSIFETIMEVKRKDYGG